VLVTSEAFIEATENRAQKLGRDSIDVHVEVYEETWVRSTTMSYSDKMLYQRNRSGIAGRTGKCIVQKEYIGAEERALCADLAPS
jgi:hypothetical protein